MNAISATNTAMPAVTSRRSILAASGAAALFGFASKPLRAAPAQSKADQIKQHVEALVSLIRSEFPEAERVGMQVGGDDTGKTWITAQASRREWLPDDRMRSGGMWVDRSLGMFAPEVGHF